MDFLDEFLQQSKRDLGYFEYLDIKKTMHRLDRVITIPVMNIPRKELAIRPEVVKHFKIHDVSPDLLTFRDEIDCKRLSLTGKTLEVVLVGHQALPEEDSFLTDSVIKVIDHQPRDANWPWHLRDVYIQLESRCVTLLATRLLEAFPEFVNCRIGNLLLVTAMTMQTLTGVIYMESNTRARLKHAVQHCSLEECRLDDCRWKDGDTVCSRLVQTKSNIGELSLDDLLVKDVKVVGGVPIVALPILIRKFISLEPPSKTYEAICNFAEARNSRVVILLGMLNESNQMKKDICLFSLSPDYTSPNYKLADDVSLRAAEIFSLMHTELFLAETIHLTNGGMHADYNGKWQLMLADQTILAVTRTTMAQIVRDIIKLFHDFKRINQLRPNFVGEKLGCSSSFKSL